MAEGEGKMDKRVVALMVAAGIIAVIALAYVGTLFFKEKSPDIVSNIEHPSNLSIIADNVSVEVGQNVLLTAQTELSPEVYNFRWNVTPSEIGKLSEDGKTATFVARIPGRAIISLTVNGKTVEKEITVYPRATISVEVNSTWAYVGNPYGFKILSEGVNITDVYVCDSLGARVAKEESFVDYWGEEKLLLEEPGNYFLVAEGNALSDGREISKMTPFSVRTEIVRGYHKFSLEEEDLISLTFFDEEAIKFFIKEKTGIEYSLEEGKEFSVNSISVKYLFYRDSSRQDAICYQENVRAESLDSPSKTFRRVTVKGSDGRFWVVATDGIVVAAYPDMGTYYCKEVLPYSSDGGSASGGISGGGGKPSPPPDEPAPDPEPGPAPDPNPGDAPSPSPDV